MLRASSFACFALLILISALVLCAAPARAGEAWVGDVRVRWDAGLEAEGQLAAQALPAIRAEVDRRLGWQTDGRKAEIRIVTGLDRMREVARAQVPAWAVGAALSSRDLILIRTDLLARGYGGTLPQVLRHEWVHLTWGWEAGPARRHLPLWVEEGLAEEIGGGISVDAGAALDYAVAFQRLHDFEDLRYAFPADARDADLAYKQSRSWVQYLVIEAGWPALQAVLEDIRKTQVDAELDPGQATPFEDALRAHTNKPLGEWHAAWRTQLEEEAVPWPLHLLIQNFQGLLIAALALIGLGTFGFLIRRRRRQIDRLPDAPLPLGFDGPGERS
jgi:hypothetical protein